MNLCLLFLTRPYPITYTNLLLLPVMILMSLYIIHVMQNNIYTQSVE